MRCCVLALLLLAGCGAKVALHAHDPFDEFDREIVVSTDEIMVASLSDAELEEVVIDVVLVEIGRDYENPAAAVARLSPDLRAFVATWWLENELLNGRFSPCFPSLAGGLMAEAAVGYRRFGADEHAALASAAAGYESECQTISSFAGAGDFDGSARVEANLGAIGARLVALAENARALRIRFVRAHPTEFAHAVNLGVATPR